MSDPTDERMWRQLLARCHPDSGGSEELFKWAQQLREAQTPPRNELPPWVIAYNLTPIGLFFPIR